MPSRRKNSQRTQRNPKPLKGSEIAIAEQPIACNTSVESMLAGGRDPSNAFKDLRSSSKPANRTKTQKRKYLDYRVVNPGQVSQPHYAAPKDRMWGVWPMYPADLSTCEVTNLTKKQLYKEAQISVPLYLAPYKCSCCVCNFGTESKAHWQGKEAKREAYNWNKFSRHQDFPGYGRWDDEEYEECAWMDIEDYYEFGPVFGWFCSCGIWDMAHGICDVEPIGANEEDEPQAVYDLETLVDNAIAGLRMPIKEPGWEDLAATCWDSPEMGWADEVADLSDGEDFEWI